MTTNQTDKPDKETSDDGGFHLVIIRDGIEGYEHVRAATKEEFIALLNGALSDDEGGRYLLAFRGKRLDISMPVTEFKVGDIVLRKGLQTINPDGYIG